MRPAMTIVSAFIASMVPRRCAAVKRLDGAPLWRLAVEAAR